jgi:hypothetical protein
LTAAEQDSSRVLEFEIAHVLRGVGLLGTVPGTTWSWLR